MLFKKRMTALLLAAVVLASGSAIAFAQPDGENDSPHTHEYHVITFSQGVVSYKCRYCNDVYSETFASRLNERNYAPLDVVADGVINAKDYAFLINHYDSFGPINGYDDGSGDWEAPGIEI